MWSGRYQILDTRECAVISVGDGLNFEAQCDLYGRKGEHDRNVGYESPPDTLPSAVDEVEQRDHTLKEQYDNDP